MEQAARQRSPFADSGRVTWALRRAWRARLRPIWRELRAPLVVVAGLAVIVLGTIGWHESGRDWPAGVFKSVQLFGLAGGAFDTGDPVTLNVARVLGPLLVGIAAIKGLLVLSREQLRLVGFRLLRREHVVVAGLGDVGFHLATALNEAGARLIVIERDPAAAALEGCHERGISVLIGDASDPGVLDAACVGRAAYLIVTPGDDGVAIDVLAAALAVTGGRADRPLRAFAEIADRGLWRALEARNLTRGHDPDVAVELFNVVDSGVRLLLSEQPPFDPDRPNADRPRVLLLADGPIAETMVLHLARLWRAARPRAKSRAEVTLAGVASGALARALSRRHPELDSILRLSPWEVEPDAEELFEDRRGGDADAVYVALNDEARGATAALALATVNRTAAAIVLVTRDERLGAATLASHDDRTGRVQVFGVLGRTLQPGMLFEGLGETLARAMHASYVRAGLARGDATSPSLKAWDQIDGDARRANRDFAAAIPEKLAALGCVVVPSPLADPERPRRVGDLDGEIERLARSEHERWMRDSLAAGWRYGERRDDAAHLHPSLVPYDELSEDEREKDRAAVRDLPRMLAEAGFSIERVTGPG